MEHGMRELGSDFVNSQTVLLLKCKHFLHSIGFLTYFNNPKPALLVMVQLKIKSIIAADVFIEFFPLPLTEFVF